MEYTPEDFKDLLHLVPRIHDVIGYLGDSYTCLEDIKYYPQTYAFLSKPLDQMPLYLNSKIPFLVEVAKWRLEHNK